jgi:DNA repair protein RadD
LKTLRPYQNAAVESIFKYFADGMGKCPLIVAPVGAGKSLIHAEIIKRIDAQAPRTKIVSLTHVKELLEQNAEELYEHCPNVDFGFYCAGLGQKRLSNDVTFASIQSVHNKALKFTRAPQVILIDEAHLISHNDATTYRKFIDTCFKLNPNLVVIGLTGTPFRSDSGRLDEGNGALFDGIAYQIDMAWMIEQGYWCKPVTPIIVKNKLNVEGVQTRGGDYVVGQLAKAVDVDEKTKALVAETIELGKHRNKWLVFTAGVNHCKNIRDAFRISGISAEMVLGDTPKDERKSIIERFKNGEFQALINVATLTTGFNVPDVDMLVFARPTKSPVLYIQTTGRGVRTVYADGYDLTTQKGRLDAIANSKKKDCLILDFGGVIDNLGPIDQLDIRKVSRNKETKEKGEAATKLCPSCGETCFSSQRVCYQCSYNFISEDLHTKASNASILSSEQQPSTYTVIKMILNQHTKRGSNENDPKSLRVTYITMAGHFHEYICFEHHKFELGDNRRYAWDKAVTWHNKFDLGLRPPQSIKEAMVMGYNNKAPTHVSVVKDGKYWRVSNIEWNAVKPSDIPVTVSDEIENRKKEWAKEGINLDNEMPF